MLRYTHIIIIIITQSKSIKINQNNVRGETAARPVVIITFSTVYIIIYYTVT